MIIEITKTTERWMASLRNVEDQILAVETAPTFTLLLERCQQKHFVAVLETNGTDLPVLMDAMNSRPSGPETVIKEDEA